MSIKIVDIKTVKPNPSNPRHIKDHKFTQLVKSIRNFPEMLQLRPIVVDADNIVLGGNMRLKACIEAGLLEVPIIVASELTEEQQKEFIIKDNVGFGEWDWEQLANEWEIEQLADWGLDLPIEMEDTEIESVEDNYQAPDTIETDIVIGDLFEIGEHQLLCGDSTDSDAVAKLMNGDNCSLCFTSPPYNLGKSVGLRNGAFKGKDNAYSDHDDDMKDSDYVNLLKDFHSLSMAVSEVQAINIQSLAGNKVAILEWLHFFKNNFVDVLIWNKTNPAPAMAEKVVSSAFEFIYIFDKEQNPKRSIRTASFKRGQLSNVYTSSVGNNSHTEGKHGATFPIELASHYISNLSKSKDNIYEPFCGSGTTMVAAHQLKRKCYGMELDPKYCQVIIDRMLKLDPDLKIKRNGQPYESI